MFSWLINSAVAVTLSKIYCLHPPIYRVHICTATMTYQIGATPYKNGYVNVPLKPLFHNFFLNFSTDDELTASLSFYLISWNQSSRLITALIICDTAAPYWQCQCDSVMSRHCKVVDCSCRCIFVLMSDFNSSNLCETATQRIDSITICHLCRSIRTI